MKRSWQKVWITGWEDRQSLRGGKETRESIIQVLKESLSHVERMTPAVRAINLIMMLLFRTVENAPCSPKKTHAEHIPEVLSTKTIDSNI